MKIEPREIEKNGKRQWVVYVPKELTETEKVKRRFFVGLDEAQTFAARLENSTIGVAAAFHALDRNSQAVVCSALSQVNMDATKLMAAVELYNREHQSTPKKLIELFNEFYAVKSASGKRKRYLQALNCSIGQFLAGRGSDFAADVTAKDVQLWIDGSDYALPTKRSYLTDVRTFFNYAIKHHYCRENPVHGVEWPTLGDFTPQIYKPEELKEIFKVALADDKKLCRYLALRNFAGLRASEACKISDPNLKREYVEVDGAIAKTRARRLVQMNPPLKAWLKIAGELPVVNLDRRLDHVMRQSGVKPVKNGFRHSFCSYAFTLWGPERAARDSGHSERIFFRHYRASTPLKEAKKWQKILPNTLR